MDLIFYLVAAGIAAAGIVAFVKDRRNRATAPPVTFTPTREIAVESEQSSSSPKPVGVAQIAQGVFLGLLMWSILGAALYWLLK